MNLWTNSESEKFRLRNPRTESRDLFLRDGAVVRADRGASAPVDVAPEARVARAALVHATDDHHRPAADATLNRAAQHGRLMARAGRPAGALFVGDLRRKRCCAAAHRPVGTIRRAGIFFVTCSDSGRPIDLRCHANRPPEGLQAGKNAIDFFPTPTVCASPLRSIL